MSVRTWFDGWPVYRQLTGSDRLGRGAAARSRASEAIMPRTRAADKIVKSICPYCAVGCGQNVYVSNGKVGRARSPTFTCRSAPGADIAFVGGIIDYVLQNDKCFRDYVLAYTNAAAIVTEDFADTEDLGGVFSGLDRQYRLYDMGTWRYQVGRYARRWVSAPFG
jgi:anaerobic selenocysteine-containing dehydrogenase